MAEDSLKSNVQKSTHGCHTPDADRIDRERLFGAGERFKNLQPRGSGVLLLGWGLLSCGRATFKVGLE